MQARLQKEAVAVLQYLEQCGYVLPASHLLWDLFTLRLLRHENYDYIENVNKRAYIMHLPRYLFQQKGVRPGAEVTKRLFPRPGVALCPEVNEFMEVSEYQNKSHV